MIPDRAPRAKTASLTMLCYQQMPMIPKAPSNASQRKITNASAPITSPVQRLPREAKQKPKAADPRKRAGETLSEGHTRRIEKQVSELFKHGPLTVDQVMRRLKLAVRESASRKVLDWKNRGLIAEVTSVSTGSRNKQRAKLWGLVK